VKLLIEQLEDWEVRCVIQYLMNKASKELKQRGFSGAILGVDYDMVPLIAPELAKEIMYLGQGFRP
jgi:hypothetical protein